MRHLKKDNLEIWVLEESLKHHSGLTGKLFAGTVAFLSELTEEQARKIKNLPIKISIGSDALPNLHYLIDQLLKENGLNGLRGFPPTHSMEPFVYREVQKKHDSKVPPENIIIRVNP